MGTLDKIGVIVVTVNGKNELAEIEECVPYENGNRKLLLVSVENLGEPITIITTNAPEYKTLQNEFLAKTWSENRIIARQLLEGGIFRDTGKRYHNGFVEIPIWEMV